jgi:hypothetical protein
MILEMLLRTPRVVLGVRPPTPPSGTAAASGEKPSGEDDAAGKKPSEVDRRGSPLEARVTLPLGPAGADPKGTASLGLDGNAGRGRKRSGADCERFRRPIDTLDCSAFPPFLTRERSLAGLLEGSRISAARTLCHESVGKLSDSNMLSGVFGGSRFPEELPRIFSPAGGIIIVPEPFAFVDDVHFIPDDQVLAREGSADGSSSREESVIEADALPQAVCGCGDDSGLFCSGVELLPPEETVLGRPSNRKGDGNVLPNASNLRVPPSEDSKDGGSCAAKQASRIDCHPSVMAGKQRVAAGCQGLEPTCS